MNEFSGMGYAPGSVRGVRSFDVDKLGRLTGVTHKQVWTPDENSAECRKGDSSWTAINALLSQSVTFQFYSDTYATRGKNRKPAPKVIPTPPKEEPHTFERCACGFYGYFDGSDDYHDLGRVTAIVEGYGETVIGTRGFRAMKARILALKVSVGDVSYPLEQKIRRNYGSVPFFDSFEALVGEFPPDVTLAPSPETDSDFWTRSV